MIRSQELSAPHSGALELPQTAAASIARWAAQYKRRIAVVLALLIVGVAGWFLTRPNLMMPSPLGELVLGRADAPVTIIEYASMTCPHCARFHQTTLPELQRQFVETGQVRYIFREFPRDDLDVFAFMMVRCVGNDKSFAMIDALFKVQDKWLVDSPAGPLSEIADQTGLSGGLAACGENRTILKGVMWSRGHGAALGVQSTPTFFINGRKHTGTLSIERLQELIAKELKAAR